MEQKVLCSLELGEKERDLLSVLWIFDIPLALSSSLHAESKGMHEESGEWRTREEKYRVGDLEGSKKIEGENLFANNEV